MTRFAGQDNILGRIQELERASEEGSVPYLTPYMSSQNPPKGGSRGRSYFDYIEDKRKELDDIVRSDGGPWKKPVEPDEPDPVVPADPVEPVDPVDETPAGKKWTKKAFGDENMSDTKLKGLMTYSQTATPEDWTRAFGECDSVKYTDKHPESTGGIPTDCYWPDRGSSNVAKRYGRGGGSAHAKRGQAAARAKAAAGRNKRRGATRSGGGTGNGGG